MAKVRLNTVHRESVKVKELQDQFVLERYFVNMCTFGGVTLSLSVLYCLCVYIPLNLCIHIKASPLIWLFKKAKIMQVFLWINCLISEVARHLHSAHYDDGAMIGRGRLIPYIDLSNSALGRKFGFLCWMWNTLLSVSVLLAFQIVHPSLCLPSPFTIIKREMRVPQLPHYTLFPVLWLFAKG